MLAGSLDLAGRAALVTGTARGMGRHTARLLAEAGAHVFGVDLDAAGLAEATTEWAGEGHGHAALDLSQTAACTEAIIQAQRMHQRIDILVVAHALMIRNEIAAVDEAEFDRIVAANARSQFFLAKAALPFMTAQSFGRIVLFTSPAGFRGSVANASVYAMTKSASLGLARSIVRSHGQYNITCNLVSPGSIDTPMMRTGLTDADVAAIAESVPMRRIGRPEEVARAAVYLASGWASYVNGHVLLVDGGATMHS